MHMCARLHSAELEYAVCGICSHFTVHTFYYVILTACVSVRMCMHSLPAWGCVCVIKKMQMDCLKYLILGRKELHGGNPIEVLLCWHLTFMYSASMYSVHVHCSISVSFCLFGRSRVDCRSMTVESLPQLVSPTSWTMMG